MTARSHGRNDMRVSRTAAVVAALGILTGICCALGADETPDQQLRVQTVMQGLAAREEAVGGVGGEVLMWSFYAPSHWERLTGIGDDPRADLTTGQSGDRDIALARFRLGEQRYWYDVQMGLWAGGGPWFVADYQRASEDTDDLYLRVLCDGQYVYRYDRSHRVTNRGSVQTKRSSVASYLRGPFATGLGFAVGQLPLSKYLGGLIENGWRVDECGSVVYDGQDCLTLALLIDGERSAGRYRFWVAPGLGYAPVRCVYEYFQKENPLRGERTVYVWADYRDAGDGVYLPHRLTCTGYCYMEGEDAPAPWESQRTFEFQHLVAPLGEPSVAPNEYFFPVGTGVVPGRGDDMPAEECARMSADFVEPRAYKDWVLAMPVPEPDAELNQPLTGHELTELQQRYAALGAP